MEVITPGFSVTGWTGEYICKNCMSTLKINYLDLKVGFRFCEEQNKVKLYCREYYVVCGFCDSNVIIESENIAKRENQLNSVLKDFIDNGKYSCKPIINWA